MEAPIMLDSSTISPQTVKPIYVPIIHNATQLIQYLTLAWNMFMHYLIVYQLTHIHKTLSHQNTKIAPTRFDPRIVLRELHFPC